MPETMWSRREINGAIRLAWASGVRDALTLMQQHPLTAEQADTLAQLVVSHARLQPMTRSVLAHAHAAIAEAVLRGSVVRRAGEASDE